MSKSLDFFSNQGGNIVIIPSSNSKIESYNSFFKKISSLKIYPKVSDTLKITAINYNHPLFKNVFSKKVNNFQYPITYNHYPFSFKNSSKIVSFENNLPFISQINTSKSKIYWLSSSINKKNSNFLNSPLIVPVFFHFGKTSYNHSKLYYYLNDENIIDIDINLKNDEILNLSNFNYSFIPNQQSFQNKVKIITKNLPNKEGFYSITKKKDTLQTIAFNTPKEESLLQFLDLNTLKETHKNINTSTSIGEVFKNLNEKNKVHWLWKWFLALAIVSLLLEIFILKFYKP